MIPSVPARLSRPSRLSWRRGVLLVATIAVGVTLLARERRIEAWRAEVVQVTTGLVKRVEAGDAIGDLGPGIVVDAAVDAVRGLPSPRTVGRVDVGEEGGLDVVRVEIVGADRRCTLVWAGRPPQLVAVRKRVGVEGSATEQFGGSR